MKSQILKILQMQEEGKLTREQAAELLALLADQARDKEGAPDSTQGGREGGEGAGSGEATGPRGNPQGSRDTASGFTAASAAAAIHDLVDTAIGVGATVGRAATVWGGEFLQMVHRDEGGNSVTLSKVDSPAGEAFTFRGNSINVSNFSRLAFSQAEVVGNNVNASKLSDLSVVRGRFSQCSISGSSVSHVTIEGVVSEALAAPGAVGGTGGIVPAGLRAVTFNATKFSRVKLLGGSLLDTCTLQASVGRDWSFAEGSALRNSRMNDSNIVGLRLEKTQADDLAVERCNIQELRLRECTLARVTLGGSRLANVAISGGTWTDVRIGREPVGGGIGSKASDLQETVFENCTLARCEFAGCVFRRTTLRNLNLADLKVRHVDFTGMTLDGDAAFRAAAGV